MGLSYSNPKLVSWAAQDGRTDDLIFHLEKSGQDGLKAAPGAEKRRTPLILAAINGHLNCISVLYDAGAPLNEADIEGFTALHHAVINGHLYAAQLLLNLGANPSCKTRFGVTPIHLAASTGHIPILQILASLDLDINIQESWGQTPLIIATQQSRLDCMKALLGYNAQTEIRDHHHGNTALHVACTTKDEETVLILLDAGANPNIINLNGLSCLGVAIENKFYRILPLLIEYGACMNEIDMSMASSGLHLHLSDRMSTPIPLLRLCRVALRQGLGPNGLDEYLKQLPASTAEYIQAVRDDCCCHDQFEEIKKHALLGQTVTITTEAHTKF